MTGRITLSSQRYHSPSMSIDHPSPFSPNDACEHSVVLGMSGAGKRDRLFRSVRNEKLLARDGQALTAVNAVDLARLSLEPLPVLLEALVLSASLGQFNGIGHFFDDDRRGIALTELIVPQHRIVLLSRVCFEQLVQLIGDGIDGDA